VFLSHNQNMRDQTSFKILVTSQLDRPNSLSNRDLLLGRHRAHKARNPDLNQVKVTKAEAPKPVIGSFVTRFLNKLATGTA
jgi:hypothetical protein